MKMKNLAYAVVVVALFGGLGYLVLSQKKATPDNDSDDHTKRPDNVVRKKETVDIVDMKIVKSEIQYRPDDLSEKNEYIDRKNRIWDVKNAGGPMNVPQVEFRFVKRNADGAHRPHMVREIGFIPMKNGKPQRVMPYEISGIGLQDTGRTEKEDIFGGYIARIPWSNGKKRLDRGQQRGLYIFGGMTYYVSVVPNDTPDIDPYDRPSAYIKMPEHIPAGHKCVIIFDLGKNSLSPYSIKYHHLVVSAPKELAGEEVYYHPADKGKNSSHETIGADGKCKFTLQHVDGSLKVIEKLSSGQYITRYLVESVSGSEVSIPKDASWSSEAKNDVNFKLKLAGFSELSSHEKPSVLFSLDKEGFKEIAWKEYISSNELDFTIPPGTYYLFVGNDRKTSHRSKVTVDRSLKGKELIIQNN